MAVSNAINEQTTGICGFTGTAFTGTAVTNHAVIIGGSTSSTLSNVGPSATTGQVLQSAGSSADPAFSTATYPAVATGTGKILRADGTNWVATTATFPDTAGTSGNVLTSDGTNWSSSAPVSMTFVVSTSNTGAAPADSTTYYFNVAQNFTAGTTVTVQNSIMIPITCTINKVYARFATTGAGSNENCTLFIRKNDTSNTNVSTTIQLTAASVTASNTALGLALTAGDFITVGFTGPAWGTNPTGVTFTCTIAT